MSGQGLFYTLSLIPLFFVSLVAGLWHWAWRGVKERRTRSPYVISQTYPEDEAYRTLRRIAAMDLPGLGIFRQHYTMILDCLRDYFQAVYGIDPNVMTVGQWSQTLTDAGIDDTVCVLLWEIAAQADLVKRDNASVQPASARHVIHTARHIIDITKPAR